MLTTVEADHWSVKNLTTAVYTVNEGLREAIESLEALVRTGDQPLSISLAAAIVVHEIARLKALLDGLELVAVPTS